MREDSLVCDKHNVDYSLKARVFSVFLFIIFVVVWCFLFWPFGDGIGFSWMLENWWGAVLLLVWVVCGLVSWWKFNSGRFGRNLAVAFLGLCLTTVGIQLSQLFSDLPAGSFAYSMISFLMLAGGGLVFFWVLAPVDSSGCDCSG